MGIKTRGERIGQWIIWLVLILAALTCIFPFLYVASLSVTPTSELLKSSVMIFPKSFTLVAYQGLFSGYGLGRAYEVTLIRTALGTAINLLLTIMCAYALSKKRLPGRQIFLLAIIFTMLFGGGLIPTYLLVRWLGILNTMWSMVIPGALSAFNMLIMKSFFEQLPGEIEESAKVDGAGEFLVLCRIVLPLSLPIIATIGLFYAVGHWNSYFDAIMYINDSQLYPVQVVLRNILINFQAATQDATNENMNPASIISIQMAAVIASTVPILCVYPFIQKHFTKGVLLGSIKG